MKNNNSKFNNSIIRILKGKQYVSKRILKLHIEVVKGELPKIGNYVFLKEEIFFVHSYPIVSIKKQFFGEHYIVKIKLDGNDLIWKKHINKYIQDSGDQDVFCGISQEKYHNLDYSAKKLYVRSIVNLLDSNRIHKFIDSNLKPTIKLVNKEKNKERKGLTKIGGLPNLPKGETYPKDDNGQSCLFLSQIHISEIKKHFSSIKYWKGNGILYFFSTIDLENEDYPTFGKIIAKYFENPTNLNEKEVPNDIKKFGHFIEQNVDIIEEINIPNEEYILWKEKIMSVEERNIILYIIGILRELNLFLSDKLLGYPEPVQGCVYREAELIDKKLLWYGNKPYNNDDIVKTYESIRLDSEKWTLLYQFEADNYTKLSNYKGEFNFMTGAYYVLIKKEDLKQMNFNNTVTVLQTT